MSAEVPLDADSVSLTERNLLGALMLHPGAVQRINGLIAEDFSCSEHRLIFGAIKAVSKDGDPDPVAVFDRLTAENNEIAVGGYKNLLSMAEATIGDPARLAAGVKAHASRRKTLAALADAAAAVARGDDAAVAGILSKIERNVTHNDVHKPLRAVDVHELSTMKFRPREPLLTPILASQDLVMVYGPRGIGKTHFAMPLAIALASGGKFLSWQAPKPRKVVYLDGELPGEVMQRRVLMHCPDPEPAPGFLRIFTPDLLEMEGRGLPDLSTYQGQAEIDAMIEPDTALVIVDNLSAWARTGRENESESWLPMADWTLSLRRRGISVCLIHHAGKSGEQRGTSKKEDLLDLVLRLSRPQDYDPRAGASFVLEFTKARHLVGDAAQSLEITLGVNENRATWEYRTLESRTCDRVLALARDDMTPGEIAAELGINKSTVSRHLKAWRAAGQLTGAH